jgi:hypothetical protein
LTVLSLRALLRFSHFYVLTEFYKQAETSCHLFPRRYVVLST